MPKESVRRTHFPDQILRVPMEIRDERLTICKNCAYMTQSNGNCSVNGKFVESMTFAKAAACPLGRWGSYYGNS